MGGVGSGRRGKMPFLQPARAYEPNPPSQVARPLEYELVDLLGDEGITDAEQEAIRSVLLFVAGMRRKEKLAREESELAKLTHDFNEVAVRAEALEDAARCAEQLNGWGSPPSPELAVHIAKCIRELGAQVDTRPEGGDANAPQ